MAERGLGDERSFTDREKRIKSDGKQTLKGKTHFDLDAVKLDVDDLGHTKIVHVESNGSRPVKKSAENSDKNYCSSAIE